MEEFLHNERIFISSKPPKRPHLCCLGNGKGRSMPGKRPGQRKFQAKAKNSKGTARHKQGYIPISSATGLPAVPQSSNEQGLDTIVVNTMATDEHALGQTWSQRQEAETENWDGARGPLYDNALSAFAVPTGTLPCVICGGVATVVCRNCPSSVLCTKCDVDQHTLQPFHKRRHWTRQFWEVLPARSSVTQAGEFVQFAAMDGIWKRKRRHSEQELRPELFRPSAAPSTPPAPVVLRTSTRRMIMLPRTVLWGLVVSLSFTCFLLGALLLREHLLYGRHRR